MRYGAALPLGTRLDPVAARDMAQALDGGGFDFVGLAGHLLTAESGRYADRPPMTYAGDFHDAFTLFAYLAASTERLAFRTSILILPLYNTVHIARAAADLQNLSGGRFELGVGISWNPDEYQAAGQDFHTRGRRLDEQLVLLRELWSKPYVTFHGRWHDIDEMGLGKNTPDRPIPIWVGSTMSERPIRRAAQLGDGWTPMGEPTPDVLAQLHGYLDEADRELAEFGLTQRIDVSQGGPDDWIAEAKRLQGIGTTHLNISAAPDQGLDRLIEARRVLGEALP